MKRENKKIKHNLKVVSAPRLELEEYKGKIFKIEAFITNTINTIGNMRLVQQIKFDDLYINHLWMKVENIGNLPHGYHKLDVKVNKYKNRKNNEIKYGLTYVGKKGNKFIDNTLHKPKWMK